MGELFLRFEIALRACSLISFHGPRLALFEAFAKALSPFAVNGYDTPV
jgi:hypothetical protein